MNRKTGRGATVFVALALLAGIAAPTFAASSAPAQDAVAHNPLGAFLGVVPSGAGTATPATGAQPRAQVAQAPVGYHGGPVMYSSTVYAIYWMPSSTPWPVNYRSTVNRYFTDVAHDSFSAANPYGSDTQYSDVTAGKTRFLSYSVAFKPAINDTHPYPADGCPNYVLDGGTRSTHCFTNAQIVNEIRSVVTAQALTTGLATQYFLFTQPGVATCFTATAIATGGCYDPQGSPGFCAYHSFSGIDTAAVLYANMPYAELTGCSSGQSPQGNPADSVINGISHEHQETMTDPLGTAWFDASGNEVADKCAFVFGAPLGANTFGQYNQVIDTHQYWLQKIWSNRTQTCVQRNNFPQPTASFTFSPAAPVHGTVVHFSSTSRSGDGTALKCRWAFPSNVKSALPNPTVTFGAAGAKTITLVVTDTHGDQARLTRVISVS